MNSTLEPEQQKVQTAYLQASGAVQTQRNLPGRSGDIEKWRASELYKKAQETDAQVQQEYEDKNQRQQDIYDSAGKYAVYSGFGYYKKGKYIQIYATDYTKQGVRIGEFGGTFANDPNIDDTTEVLTRLKSTNVPIFFKSDFKKSPAFVEFNRVNKPDNFMDSPGEAVDFGTRFNDAQRKAREDYQNQLKRNYLESSRAKWSDTSAYADAYKKTMGITPSSAQVGSVITRESEYQLEAKRKQLQSGAATWASPEFYVQEVQKMERRGAKVPVDLEKTQPIYGIERSSALWTTETERNKRMVVLSPSENRIEGEYPHTRASIMPWDEQIKQQEKRYKENEEAIWNEKRNKFAAESWYDNLSPIDKGKTLFASSVTDFGVASEYFQSKITGRETNYKERVYSNIFDKGKKRDPINAAGKVGTGDFAMMAAGGVALGAGIKAVKISPTVLKWAGRAAVGYQGYSSLNDISRGDFGKAVTESAAFVGSVPYIGVGYGIKVPEVSTSKFGFKYNAPRVNRIFEIKMENAELFTPPTPAKPPKPLSINKMGFKYNEANILYRRSLIPTPEAAPINYSPEYPISKPVSRPDKLTAGFVLAFKLPETKTHPLDKPLGEFEGFKARMDSRIKDLAIKKKLTYDQAFEVLKAKREMYLTEDMPKYTPNRTDYFDDLEVELHRLEAKPKKRINTGKVVFGKAEKVIDIKEKLEIIQSPEYLQGGSADTFVIKPRTPKTKLMDMSGGKKSIKNASPFASLLLKGTKIEDFALMDTKQIYRPPVQVHHRPQFSIKESGYKAIESRGIITSKPTNIRFGMPIKISTHAGTKYKAISSQGLKPINRVDVKNLIKNSVSSMVRTSTGIRTGIGLRTSTSLATKNALRLRTRELTKTQLKTPTKNRTETPKPPKINIPRIRIPKSIKNSGVFRSKRGKKTHYGKFKEIAGVLSIKQMLKGRKIKI